MDSPYVSDLTYDLSQVAVFGEATYTFFDRLGVTAGLRWYDWEGRQNLQIGRGYSRIRRLKGAKNRDGVLQRFHAPVHGQTTT